MRQTLLWIVLALWFIVFVIVSWKEEHGAWPLQPSSTIQEQTRRRNECWDWLVANNHPLLWHPDLSSIYRHPQWHECFFCHRTAVAHGPCPSQW